VADDGDDEAVVEGHGDAEVDVPVVVDLLPAIAELMIGNSFRASTVPSG